MNRFVLMLFLVPALAGCKGKKNKPEISATNFFPVPTYIRGELKRLDTASVPFTKIEIMNDRLDTAQITNKDVPQYAKDFLDLPDIASSNVKDDYEVSHLYDDIQGAFVFNFITKEAHPLREENITVDPQPNAQGKNDIKSIYAKLEADSANGSVTKILLWEAGKGFYTTNIFDA